MVMILRTEIFEKYNSISIISEFDEFKQTFFTSFDNQKVIIVSREQEFNKKQVLKMLSKRSYLSDYFNVMDINEILEKEDNVYLSLIFALSEYPKAVIVNDLFVWLTIEKKQLLLSFAKDHGIKLVSFTSEIEEVLDSEYLIVLEDNELCLEGETLDVLKEEKLLKKLGFSLPFYYDLSLQLGYYEVLRDIHLDKKTLESEIWK